MMHFFSVFFLLLSYPFISFASEGYENSSSSKTVSKKIVEVFVKNPYSVKNWDNDKLYFFSEEVLITNHGLLVSGGQHYPVLLPTYGVDQKGLFVLCNQKEVSKEAEEHYENAVRSFLEALGYSAAAGAAIEIPPIAVFEAWKAIESWIEMGREYREGKEAEDRFRNSSDHSDTRANQVGAE